MIIAPNENMPESYPAFFERVTGNRIIPYQERYGENPFSPTRLVIPTGLGKTDAILLPWLYARASKRPAPTRLIVVLPRQNLTSQTAKIARKHVCEAGLQNAVTVLELMGGSGDNDLALTPTQPAIIVATQDLYFSRALNRGYARRPARWPVDFALYNQDCLIVLDEVQLMDDALATSTQLAAFREAFGVFAQVPTVWMSATLNPAWLNTVDFSGNIPELRLEDADFKVPLVQQRLHAAKSLAPAPPGCRTPAGCAEFALDRHQPGTRTLVVANTVARAREIFAHIRKKRPDAILLHSRFRPADRAAAAAKLADLSAQDQIVVATQVLEAGVDISAQLLVTDIAPWGSLVQRFGRVNRYGRDESASIFWVDEPTSSKQKDPAAPYTAPEIERARNRVLPLTSAAPAALPLDDGPAPWTHVLRRSDLLDLFDTTPDIAGNDLDVSRFIRAGGDKDAYLAWREWDASSGPPSGEASDDELCPVPIGDLREFIRKHTAYVWNFTEGEWAEIDRDRLYPGIIVLVRSAAGGYTQPEGWAPESKTAVLPAAPKDHQPDAHGTDAPSFPKYRQTLAKHSARVMEELELLLAAHPVDERPAAALRAAAAQHDWGKAHPVFQQTLHRNDPSPDLLAKQIGAGRHSRKHFRHELASALAMLQTGGTDLAAYLAAAHHGKVRLSIRSMPGENEAAGIRTARGIEDGDQLPAWQLGDLSLPPVTLSLAPMELGGGGDSWTARMLRLRDDFGPFRLAWLEMLLRAADASASDNPELEAAACRH